MRQGLISDDIVEFGEPVSELLRRSEEAHEPASGEEKSLDTTRLHLAIADILRAVEPIREGAQPSSVFHALTRSGELSASGILAATDLELAYIKTTLEALVSMGLVTERRITDHNITFSIPEPSSAS